MMPERGVNNSSDDQALKGACRALVRAVGGVEAAENYCRVGKTRLSDYGNPRTDLFMPVDVVMDLEADAHGTPGFPQVTGFLARQIGFALVALPTADAGADTIHVQLAEACGESNDVIEGTLKALRDGKIDRAEARALMPECIQAAEAFVRFHALLEQIAGES